MNKVLLIAVVLFILIPAEMAIAAEPTPAPLPETVLEELYYFPDNSPTTGEIVDAFLPEAKPLIQYSSLYFVGLVLIAILSILSIVLIIRKLTWRHNEK